MNLRLIVVRLLRAKGEGGPFFYNLSTPTTTLLHLCSAYTRRQFGDIETVQNGSSVDCQNMTMKVGEFVIVLAQSDPVNVTFFRSCF